MTSPSELFEGFKTWENLLDYLRMERPIYYCAVMDYHPRCVSAAAVDTDGDTLRVFSLNGAFDAFNADKSHLNRFKRRI